MDESVIVTGAVVRVLDVKSTGTNEFKTRSVHVKTEGQYPQVLEIQFTQGNITLLDGLMPGKKVRITINLKGREWTNTAGEISVFNTLVGWKIEKLA
jgi:single-strand DNA-binding protein